MLNISKYLEKVSKNINDNEAVKNKIANTITEIIGINIELKDIEIKENKLILNVSQAVKNKIFIKKQLLLEEINKIKLNHKILEIK